MSLLDPDRVALAHICRNLRELDRIEVDATFVAGHEYLFAVIPEAWRFAQFKRIFYVGERPAALFCAHETSAQTLAVSLLATDLWPQAWRAFYRWGKRTFKPDAIARGYRRAECRVYADHYEAVALLLQLGFVIECDLPEYGLKRERFYQMAWRSRDHVLLSEDSKAADAASDPHAGGRERREGSGAS
jgi:hypothetical protein